MKWIPKPLRIWIFCALSLVLVSGCTVNLKEGYRRFQENHPFFGPEKYRYEEPIPQGEPPVTDEEE